MSVLVVFLLLLLFFFFASLQSSAGLCSRVGSLLASNGGESILGSRTGKRNAEITGVVGSKKKIEREREARVRKVERKSSTIDSYIYIYVCVCVCVCVFIRVPGLTDSSRDHLS